MRKRSVVGLEFLFGRRKCRGWGLRGVERAAERVVGEDGRARQC